MCVGIFIFIIQNRMNFSICQLSKRRFGGKGIKMSVWADFWTKKHEKVTGEKSFIDWNSSSIALTGKKRNFIRGVFTWTVISPNFISSKNRLKTALESFASINWHLWTALKLLVKTYIVTCLERCDTFKISKTFESLKVVI